MQPLLIGFLAVLCASMVPGSAACDCRTAASCPQAYFTGTPTGCYLNGGRTVGVCCPAHSSPATGFGLFAARGGLSGQSHASLTGPAQGARQTAGSGSFRNPIHTSRFQGGAGGGFSRAPSVASTSTGSASTSYGPPQYGRYPTPPPSGECRPLVLCPPVVVDAQALYSGGCTLADGSPGVRCSFSRPQLAARSPLAASQGLQPLASAQSFVEQPLSLRASPGALQQAQQAQQAQRQNRQLSGAAAFAGGSQSISAGQSPAVDSPNELFFFNSQSPPAAQQIGAAALQSLGIVTSLAAPAPAAFPPPAQGGRPTSQAAQGGQGSQTTIDPTCTPDPPISCANSFYRTVTGECNNLQEPRWGKGLTGFKRLLPNTFDDGIFQIRTRAVRGGPLPSARFISERVLDTFSNELRDHTLSLMQLSQFVDHDLTHALVFRLPNGDGIECCLDDGQTFPTTPRHPQCIPIPIPANDPFYSRFGQRCMSLVRSLPALQPDCVARPATPLNELTHWLDGSNVYGSSEEEARNLRAFRNGLLRESPRRLLPLDERVNKPCRRRTCYIAGDSRVNEQSLLAVTHTIWMREHNRIAHELQARHPRWGDERLYQEARRILGAEWQHIVYNEWLPVVLGFDYTAAHGLLPLSDGYSHFYDPRINPSISNAFASAAFRFGHSMVRDMYDLLNANGVVTGSFNLSSTFFDPTVLETNDITEHARTMIAMRSETFDTSFVPSLHEQLFTTNNLFGLDLLALNIQRGRDHGTPTYVQVAQACNHLPRPVRFWPDLRRVMSDINIDKLRSVYDHPGDVDLFIGGVSEQLAPGAQVGPTFQCLIAQQFFDLRYGDRFFYDNGGMPHSFSLPQLRQIRRSNWARILCDTLGPEFLNDFTQVQPLAILTPLALNQIVSCDTLAVPRVDLGVF